MDELTWLSCTDPGLMYSGLLRAFIGKYHPEPELTTRKLAKVCSACAMISGYKVINDSDEQFAPTSNPLGMMAYRQALESVQSLCLGNANANFYISQLHVCGVLREVFGNPWKPSTTRERLVCKCGGDYGMVKKDWAVLSMCNRCRSEGPFWQQVIEGKEPDWTWKDDKAVYRLARSIYDSNDFSQAAILADMMEELGCSSRELCQFCYGKGYHQTGLVRNDIYGTHDSREKIRCISCDNGRKRHPFIAHLRQELCSCLRPWDNEPSSLAIDLIETHADRFSADQDCRRCLGTGKMKHLQHFRGCHVIDAILGLR